MKNPYLHIDRIEFAVTFLCSGKCKHCSVSPRLNQKGCRCIDPEKAEKAIRSLSAAFPIQSLMTFGGEPLLFSDTTCRIHQTASECGIAERQLITNGFFSKNSEVIEHTATSIRNAGINDILISVDVFHQETIPLPYVRLFAEALLRQNIPQVQFHPAWVINSSHQNKYNEQTYQLLNSLSDLGIGVSEGNNIFPAGNAAKFLREYYPKPQSINLASRCGGAPYTQRLDDVHSLSIEPDGTIVICAFPIGNIVKEDIETIINRYDPYANQASKSLMDGGVQGLVSYAQNQRVAVDTGDCYSACSICRKTIAALNKSVS